MSNIDFDTSDVDQIQQAGLKPEDVKQQLALFQKTTPLTPLLRPATLGDGIVSIAADQATRLTAKFEAAQQAGRIAKFVPASGAATRMFKALYQALEEKGSAESSASRDVDLFFARLPEFAFFEPLKKALADQDVDVSTSPSTWPRNEVLQTLLNSTGLGYGKKPKGLLAFHLNEQGPCTPVEEHFHEALAYGLDREGCTRIHFTVSEEHLPGFQELVAHHNEQLAKKNHSLDVSFSVQKPSTDTIAANPDGTPFRTPEGRLVFRPGGHGALIENLNDLEGDILILKNIDNVVPVSQIALTVQYKKLLGGLLLDIQQRIHKYLGMLDRGEMPPRREIFRFMQENMGLKTAKSQRFEDANLADYLKQILDRPLRVCGMVRNQGEPGGGPFWVAGPDGQESLQIVEASQIDQTLPAQKAILNKATHFNPVDLVCATRDFKGRPFSLADFIDPNAYFISSKSQFGKPLLALERPGLWNGAMAYWNTLFVEVPLSTFNPVKTINDLLRPEHLAG